MGGKAGIELFKFLYLKHFNLKTQYGSFQQEIQKLAESSLEYTFPTISNGKAGINWFFTYLYKQNILQINDWKLLCSDDQNLAEISLQMLKRDNYDFLHGGMGIAYYLLYKKAKEFTSFYEDFLNSLELLICRSKGKETVPHFDFDTYKLNPGIINLGLAHGIPSILKFSIQCYQQGVCQNKARRLSENIIDYLITHRNKNSDYCCYPNLIPARTEVEDKSRLAWCFGDLSIGYILYQAATIFNNESLKEYSLEILLHTTKRRAKEDTLIFDASFCHGSSGVAHIYNKLWHSTNDMQFQDASNFWITETIRFSQHKNGVAGYSFFEPPSQTYVNRIGLLEGAAGIGLSLVSFLTTDFSWDYCLMLND